MSFRDSKSDRNKNDNQVNKARRPYFWSAIQTAEKLVRIFK